MLHHFILTRFNLRLWSHDKNGETINPASWLEERLQLFETYTLPSVKGQTCQDFTWVLLVDRDTPVDYRERMKAYREQCPQMVFIAVGKRYAAEFARIFEEVVNEQLKEKDAHAGDLCLTTYLDNDDCLHKDYIQSVHSLLNSPQSTPPIAKDNDRGAFITFDYGLQYYTELGIATRIKYSNNHFITLAEPLIPSNPSTSSSFRQPYTCYGYGSHFYLEKREILPVNHIIQPDKPMWVEVIHKDNVDNDVKMTLHTRLINDTSLLRNSFSLDLDITTGKRWLFLKRFIQQAIRRAKNKML